MQVETYLFFDGRCEEALQFYAKAVGAQTNMLMRFKDNPEPPPSGTDGSNGEKIMHASFRIGDTTLGASDGDCMGKPAFQGVSLTLRADTDAESELLFAALSDGGSVNMPMTKTFFASRFGMLKDRFGVAWIVMTSGPAN